MRQVLVIMLWFFEVVWGVMLYAGKFRPTLSSNLPKMLSLVLVHRGIQCRLGWTPLRYVIDGRDPGRCVHSTKMEKPHSKRFMYIKEQSVDHM